MRRSGHLSRLTVAIRLFGKRLLRPAHRHDLCNPIFGCTSCHYPASSWPASSHSVPRGRNHVFPPLALILDYIGFAGRQGHFPLKRAPPLRGGSTLTAQRWKPMRMLRLSRPGAEKLWSSTVESPFAKMQIK